MSVYRRKADGKWVYDFWRGGLRFCGTIEGCSTKRAAEAAERTKITEAKQQLAAARESREGPMTVDVAFDRFWLEVGTHYTSTYGKTVWGALEWMLKEFGTNTLLRDLSPNRITEAIARRRADEVKPATVNRTLTELLRRIFIRARRKWQQEVQEIDWTDMLLDEPKERVRELRDHEEVKLLARMRQDYLPAIAFFLVSGCRLKEVVALRWADIDWTAKTIAIRGKGDKFRSVPLTSEIAAILAPLMGHHAEHVFTYVGQRTRQNPRTHKTIASGQRYPITYEGMKTAWRRHGAPVAGIEDYRLHDNRHTAATRLLRGSRNLKLVQKLLGHEDITTTVKYAHADDADLRAAMESVAKSHKKSRKKSLRVVK